jgi:endonuclease III
MLSAPDARRAEVFEGLRTLVGLDAASILQADPDVLLTLARRGGMGPEARVARWIEIAQITMDQFHGNLDAVFDLPLAQAKRALQKFPSIGGPGADKILLFCGIFPGLPLESNGLRALLRLGYGRKLKDYAAQYRSDQEALAGQLPKSPANRVRAHLLLRQHGQELCKTPRPLPPMPLPKPAPPPPVSGAGFRPPSLLHCFRTVISNIRRRLTPTVVSPVPPIHPSRSAASELHSPASKPHSKPLPAFISYQIAPSL